ncbi:hypothetical protein [Streptomyces sp. NPDC017964]|uniref:hypothetical protein n=1 Tax=Streptomyces sp. NPDC017964 TaxID=3365022 RepID=UPI003794D741
MAYHEAGEAVVVAAYGAHVKCTGVTNLPAAPDKWELTGRTELDGPPIPLWRLAAQNAAGERAQSRYMKSIGQWGEEARRMCENHDDFEFTAATFDKHG